MVVDPGAAGLPKTALQEATNLQPPPKLENVHHHQIGTG